MLLPLIAVACYVIGAVWLATATYQHRSEPFSAHGRGGRIAAVAIASVGVLVHAIALMQERHLAPGAALSLGDTLALVSLTIAITAIVMAVKPGRRGMAALLLLIAAVQEVAFSEGARKFSMLPFAATVVVSLVSALALPGGWIGEAGGETQQDVQAPGASALLPLEERL